MNTVLGYNETKTNLFIHKTKKIDAKYYRMTVIHTNYKIKNTQHTQLKVFANHENARSYMHGSVFHEVMQGFSTLFIR